MSCTAAQSAFLGPDQVGSLPHTVQDSPKARRGSLPLKKRKLLLLDLDLDEDPSPKPANYPASGVSQEDDKTAALTLLAAASGALTRISPVGQLEPLMALSKAAEAAERKTPPQTSMMAGPPEPVKFGVHDFRQVGPSPVTPVANELPGRPVPVSSGSSAGSNTQRPRVHHPPLSSPLPNGCHGRTSRNNSFCRRTPCYNGSQYCKLHYQQYVVAGTRIPVQPGLVSQTNSVTNTPVSNAHQDKRFTGCGSEVRCAATTTRGRSCAYIAVNETKYCHLHADYDTNPPPRRGGGSSSSTSSKTRQLLTKASLDILPRMQGCPTIPDLGGKRFSLGPLKPTLMPLKSGNISQSPPSVSSDDTFHAPGTTSPDVSIGSSSKQVLLSSISSDRWLNRKVMIATGPLVNRTGMVEKWGNGWVTVRVRDGLTHNRRSVELYLIPDEAGPSDDDSTKKEEVASQASQSSSTSERIVEASSVNNDGMAGDAELPSGPAWMDKTGYIQAPISNDIGAVGGI